MTHTASNAPRSDHPLINMRPVSLEDIVIKEMHLAAHHNAAEQLTGLNVVDVGCNHGYGSRIVAAKAATVTGIDLSEEAIAEARKTNTMPNVQFLQSNAYTMPFDKESFDAAVSFQVIEHMAEVERYLAEIIRVVKPGGKVIFTTPNRAIRLVPGRAPWNRFHVREYDARDLNSLLLSFFREVTVSGMYATGPIYEIEHKRQLRKRSKQAGRKLQDLPSRLAHSVGRATGWNERRMRRRLGAPPAYTDFFYRGMTGPTSLDDSLDLQAVCLR